MCYCYSIVVIIFLVIRVPIIMSFFFFFNDTATTEIYTLSLHDALPIFAKVANRVWGDRQTVVVAVDGVEVGDRKSTRLNSSHSQISYAVFCLKKKKKLVRTANGPESGISMLPDGAQ